MKKDLWGWRDEQEVKINKKVRASNAKKDVGENRQTPAYDRATLTLTAEPRYTSKHSNSILVSRFKTSFSPKSKRRKSIV